MNTKYSLLKEVYENNREFKEAKEIIHAMNIIDRRYFVSDERVYEDYPLPIGHGQTISQPTTVAKMILMLRLKKGMEVLEIGSGSGWNAALVAFLIYPGKVVSVERIKEISKLAVSNLFNFIKQSKFKKLQIDFVFADAMNKKESFWKSKYDRIIITAMVGDEFSEKIKEMGKKLLKEKGMLLFPFNDGLELWRLKDKNIKMIERKEGYVFVPLLKGKE
jgi:protein-L-isoaspartate(D-aspartate) O-methyltransferase